MKLYQNIVEYYDELYPVTKDLKHFFNEEMAAFDKPAKILRIGCATGSFEHTLAKEGSDVTGIENISALLESANRKRRTQLMAIRFFQMSTSEMNRFLGKGFYNIVSMLDSRIIFTSDLALMKKLFIDCKELLTKNGKFILSLLNFNKFNVAPAVELPSRKSIRTALYARIVTERDGSKFFDQSLETGRGKMITVSANVPVLPITSAQIRDFAKEAGFASCAFYADYARAPFDEKNSDTLVAVLS